MRFRPPSPGTVDFEVVYDWGIRMTNPATEGVFYDLKQVNNVDLDQRYWAPSSQDDLTIADKLLIFTNDISMNRIGWASFIFFNKRIVEDLNYTIPYEYVNNNTWTYDVYLDMILGAAQDNGDMIWNQEDQYGSLSNSGGELSSFVFWSGFKGTTKKKTAPTRSMFTAISSSPSIRNTATSLQPQTLMPTTTALTGRKDRISACILPFSRRDAFFPSAAENLCLQTSPWI